MRSITLFCVPRRLASSSLSVTLQRSAAWVNQRGRRHALNDALLRCAPLGLVVAQRDPANAHNRGFQHNISTLISTPDILMCIAWCLQPKHPVGLLLGRRHALFPTLLRGAPFW